VQQDVCNQLNREMIGKTVEVMVEGVSKLVSRQAPAAGAGMVELGWEKRRQEQSATTQLIGRTRGDQVVAFDGMASQKGEILDVEITDARGMTLFGRTLRSARNEAPALTK
jgi:tRNA A37 methylthiotransferase MiaB